MSWTLCRMCCCFFSLIPTFPGFVYRGREVLWAVSLVFVPALCWNVVFMCALPGGTRKSFVLEVWPQLWPVLESQRWQEEVSLSLSPQIKSGWTGFRQGWTLPCSLTCSSPENKPTPFSNCRAGRVARSAPLLQISFSSPAPRCLVTCLALWIRGEYQYSSIFEPLGAFKVCCALQSGCEHRASPGRGSSIPARAQGAVALMALWGAFVPSIAVTPSTAAVLYLLSETPSVSSTILPVQLGKVKVQGFGLIQPDPSGTSNHSFLYPLFLYLRPWNCCRFFTWMALLVHLKPFPLKTVILKGLLLITHFWNELTAH